jgi:hypothetical protein
VDRRRDEHELRRRGRRLVVLAEDHADEPRHQEERGRQGEHEQRGAGDVAPEPGEHDLRAAALPVARLVGEQDHPHWREEDGHAHLRRLGGAEEAHVSRRAHDAEDERGDPRPQRDESRVGGALEHEPENRPPVLAERDGRRGREAPHRGDREAHHDRARHGLRGHEPGDGRGHAVLGADRDTGEPQAHRERQQRAAQVIAPAQDHGRRADRVEGLQRGQDRGDQHRPLEALCVVEDRADERCEGDDDHAGPERGQQLVAEGCADEPVEPSPVLACGVAEAVLDERLVARQPEERREEVHDAEHDRVTAGLGRAEDAKHDERREDAEGGGGVDSRRRDAPAVRRALLGHGGQACAAQRTLP